MKILAPFLLAAATVATAVAGTMPSVTVQASNVSFKDAMAACPGALAGISFSLNHLRVSEQAGVVSDLDDANPMAQVLMLQDAKGASATVTVNAKAHTVSAKNVKLGNKNVACVSAD
jgi:spore maturation protein SpmA